MLFGQRRSLVDKGILVPSRDFLIKERITATLRFRIILHSCLLEALCYDNHFE